jgi:hypothetical protein
LVTYGSPKDLAVRFRLRSLCGVRLKKRVRLDGRALGDDIYRRAEEKGYSRDQLDRVLDVVERGGVERVMNEEWPAPGRTPRKFRALVEEQRKAHRELHDLFDEGLADDNNRCPLLVRWKKGDEVSQPKECPSNHRAVKEHALFFRTFEAEANMLEHKDHQRADKIFAYPSEAGSKQQLLEMLRTKLGLPFDEIAVLVLAYRRRKELGGELPDDRWPRLGEEAVENEAHAARQSLSKRRRDEKVSDGDE